MHKPGTEKRLINRRWVIAGVLVACLVSVAAVSENWPRMADDVKVRTSVLALGSSIFASYLLWIGIALFINSFRQRVPMFSREQPNWWLIHGALSLVIGLVHMLFDTAFLWLALSGGFNLIDAYLEKLLRWLPYEILGYWACLGIFTAVARREFVHDSTLPTDSRDYLSRFPIKTDEGIRIIKVDDISWIEAYDNYVLIWQDREHFIIKSTMNKLEQTLNPQAFIRTHRSAIVNLNHVDSLVNDESGQVCARLHGGKLIPISRRRRGKVRKLLSNGF